MPRLSALGLRALLAIHVGTAGITGVVKDGMTGAPIPGAVVSLDDLGRAAVTGEDGRYWLPDVPPGPQHLSVRLLGYRSRSLHVLVPATGTLRVDLVLRTEPIEVEAVVVRSWIPIRGVDEKGPSLDPIRRLSAAALRNDPFSSEPDVVQALAGGPVSNSTESGGGLHVRGGKVDEVGYLLDDIPVFSPYHSGIRSSAWNPDALSRVELHTDPTLAADALSGAVVAYTIEPGERFRSRGGLSTSQAGVTLDGPVFGPGGFLLAIRSGYPGLARPPEESSYLRGEDYDVLGKLQTPAAGGSLRLLAFDNQNIVRASSRSTEADDAGMQAEDRNRFSWHGNSVGLMWDREPDVGRAWSVRAWRASLAASALWHGEDPSRGRVESDREEIGLLASVRRLGSRGNSEIGLRITHGRTSYTVGPSTAGASILALDAKGSDVAAFAKLSRRVSDRFEMNADLLATAGHAGEHLLPRFGVRVGAGEQVLLYAEYTRSIQTRQSLRNPESVVENIFPAELYAAGAPVARSHTLILGTVAVPRPGARLALETYARSTRGLALVAPEHGGPFATQGTPRGSGSAVGASIEASVSAARYAAIASYSVDRIRVRTREIAYRPGFAATQRLRAGAIVFPWPTLSIRTAWIAELGRKGTDTIGSFEWESCNLLDLGCEFAGSPEELGPLGATELPAYHRLDLSIRKHWHVALAGRDTQLEAYATASNVLGRTNVLTFLVDPETGERVPLEMRPRAPLTLGLGWSY